jgi:hypothetical protein
MESGFDGLNALFDTLSLLWNWTDCFQDLVWHSKVAKLGSLWFTAVFIVLFENWWNLHDQLFEILDHLLVLWSNFFSSVLGRELLHVEA